MASASSKRPTKGRADAAANTLARKFSQLGLETDADFVVHLPLRYEDETAVHAIGDARAGLPQQFEGEVVEQIITQRPRKQLQVILQDQSGRITLRWLHFYPSQLKQLAEGQRVRVRGEVRRGFHGLELVHPKVTKPDQGLSDTLTPVYPASDGLRQQQIQNRINEALERLPLQDTLPEVLREQFELPNFAESLKLLHHPPRNVDAEALMQKTHPAWQRIKFDELLAQQLSLAAARAARRKQKSWPLVQKQGELEQQLRKRLGFKLTAAQERVVAEIADDLTLSHPMHRLLQGDVGSGKTVVAAMAAAQAIDSGYQVALMAPTELLAEQHYQKMTLWFEPLGITVGWLSGSQTAKQRAPVLEGVHNGHCALVVGTQALIQDGVEFHKLGLVILDEQHRFGVGQRLSLSRKGEQGEKQKRTIPHQLNMSATPIPRTLAMSFLADLDVSVIDELPAGRTPVITKLLSEHRREEVIAHIYAQIQEGRQVYWVCPLVEESEALQLQTAVDTYHHLAEQLAGVRVGLLHGKLPTQEKAQIMEAFRSGEVQVLVATTVIEVGVDVPNANLMVIEHAERFGLAQLHQLRGRVGRGAHQAVCVLLYSQPLSAIARERLKAMYETTDGFDIARRDLALRGPGEFLGVRQSGQALLRFASLDSDEYMIEQAQECAVLLREQYPEHAHAHVQRWLKGREEFLRT